MARFVFLVLFLLAFRSFGIQWRPGSVVLAEGNVLVGDVARQSNDLILLRSGGEITVLPAHRVQSFRFYDAQQNVNRKFVALRADVSSKRQVFYEMVTAGSLSVLRKQRHFNEHLIDSDTEEFDFFIFSGGEIVSLRSFKSRYYDEVSHELERAGVRTSSFNPNEPADAMKMILMFNKLPGSQPVAAI